MCHFQSRILNMTLNLILELTETTGIFIIFVITRLGLPLFSPTTTTATTDLRCRQFQGCPMSNGDTSGLSHHR